VGSPDIIILIIMWSFVRQLAASSCSTSSIPTSTASIRLVCCLVSTYSLKVRHIDGTTDTNMQLSVTESSFEPRTARVVARACWRHTLARANISCDILFNNNIDSLNKKTTRSKCSHAVISIKLCLDNRAFEVRWFKYAIRARRSIRRELSLVYSRLKLSRSLSLSLMIHPSRSSVFTV